MPWDRFNPLPHLAGYNSLDELYSDQDRAEIDDLCKKIREMWTSEPLTPNQRVFGAMMGEDIDRVPYGLPSQPYKFLKKMGGNYGDIYQNPAMYVKAVLMAILAYGLDMGAPYIPVGENQSDLFGTQWAFPEDSMPSIIEWGVKEGLREIIDNDLPDFREGVSLKWWIESINFMNSKLGDLSNFTFLYALGPYYMYCSALRGPKEAFYDIKKNPELAVEAFDKLSDYIIDYLKYFMEQTKSPTWMMIDSLISPSFTPPPWYEKFCAPFSKKIVDAMAPAPGSILGGGQGQTDFTPLLESLADIGYRGFSFGPPTDLAKMKKLSNERGIFLAHMSLPTTLMRYGTPEEIEEHVKDCIRIGAPGKRYMLGGDLPDHDTPDESMHAAKRALLKYGKYPLQFE